MRTKRKPTVDTNELKPHVSQWTIYTCRYYPCSFQTGNWFKAVAKCDYERHKAECKHRHEFLARGKAKHD